MLLAAVLLKSADQPVELDFKKGCVWREEVCDVIQRHLQLDDLTTHN